jgi:hypothetical protein|tara:strand:+ start:271 stop:444 length:174 start_codon:yes stop_codon:yes gene_type:complete
MPEAMDLPLMLPQTPYIPFLRHPLTKGLNEKVKAEGRKSDKFFESEGNSFGCPTSGI